MVRDLTVNYQLPDDYDYIKFIRDQVLMHETGEYVIGIFQGEDALVEITFNQNEEDEE
jgi:hypothetical protein